MIMIIKILLCFLLIKIIITSYFFIYILKKKNKKYIDKSKNKNTEYFDNNDKYNNDKYIDTIAVPAEFYMTSKLPETHYAYEMDDIFFTNTLNNKKINITNIDITNKINIGNKIDMSIKKNLLNETNLYLCYIFNKELSKDQTFYFKNINSEIIDIYEINISNNYIILKSKHIIYRDTKLYGISISLTTLHSNYLKINDNNNIYKNIENKNDVEDNNIDIQDNKNSNIMITDFKVNGFIFEDKINAYNTKNLINNDYQKYKQDTTQLQDNKYENTFLCNYYKILKQNRGITSPFEQTLNCLS